MEGATLSFRQELCTLHGSVCMIDQLGQHLAQQAPVLVSNSTKHCYVSCKLGKLGSGTYTAALQLQPGSVRQYTACARQHQTVTDADNQAH